MTFTPTAAGSRTASLTITDNGSGSPQSVSLSGTGTAAASPVVNLSPSSLSVNVSVGTAGMLKATLTNQGPGALTISSIAITGPQAADYSQTNNCPVTPATLPASASCAITITFTPSSTGLRSAAVTITDNGSASPQSITLSGTGVTPVVTLSRTSLSGSFAVGTTISAAVTLTNTGPGGLSISSIAITGAAAGDYSQTNNCPVSPATLAASASCTITVTFAPLWDSVRPR
ncbi:MAG TPA: choice-of-anchor D domain-containing protein [Bryobacteraceae bacterium]